MARANLLVPARRALLALAVTAAMATACDETTTAAGTPSLLTVVNGNNQTLITGSGATDSLVIRIDDQNGSPLAGVSVAWTITAGQGSLSLASTTTDANGQAYTIFTPGAGAGSSTVTADVSGLSAAFTIVVESAPPAGNEIKRHGVWSCRGCTAVSAYRTAGTAVAHRFAET